jgi:hypothetical protein
MTQTSSATPEVAATVESDHRWLRATISRLEDELIACKLAAADAERELAALARELDEHFRHEEAGGFFAEVLEAAPELQDRVESLRQQHRQLREMVRGLRGTCRWACVESGARTGWLAAFADFHRLFDQHESAEHSLLHESLLRDMGAAD